jgi:hypothetical protein
MSFMRFKIFFSVAAAAILAGCTEPSGNMGAAVDNDLNVLTGGPITGTTIQDLPVAVQQALHERVPHGEIAGIARSHRDGNIVYEISFLQSDYPEIQLQDDGKVLSEPVRAKK